MLALWVRELSFLCRGIKTLIVLSVFIGFTYAIANVVHLLPYMQQDMSVSSSYSRGLRFLILFLGFLFVMMRSHDTINREMETQTIRYLVTKTSRMKVVMGKFFGVLSFWFLVVTISYIPILLKAQQVDFLDYFRLLTYLCMMVSVTLFFSVTIKKPERSVFVSFVFSVFYPIISILSVFKSGVFWNQFQVISLFHYVKEDIEGLVFPLLVSVVCVLGSIIVFQRRDL